MNVEAAVKADRERKDFVWVRQAGGAGSVCITAGGFSLKCTPTAPAEITRAEWEHIFKATGALEEVPKTEGKKQPNAGEKE